MAEIRSVSVHLDADVASYIAKMRLAGAETDKAFGRSTKGVTNLNSALKSTEAQLGKVSAAERKLGGDVDRTNRSVGQGAKDIDRYGGRLGILGDAILALGPALIPIGAVLIPSVFAMGTTFIAAAGAMGVFKLATLGVGAALTAANKYAINPTAANLAIARRELNALPPSARNFTIELQKMKPELDALRASAADGFLPGAQQGLKALTGDLPIVQRIISGISGEMGVLARDTGQALSSSRWKPFLHFIGTEAPLGLAVLGRSAGSVFHGIAALFMAFTPATHNLDRGILNVSRDFDRWATNLNKTKGFQDFLQYVEANGPKVLALLGATATTFFDITRAAAPLGGPVLDTLTAVLHIIDAIAKSDLGGPLFLGITAMRLLSRTTQLWGTVSTSAAGKFVTSQKQAVSAVTTVISAQQRATMSATELAAAEQRTSAGWKTIGSGALKAGAAAAGFALIASGVTDKLHLTNTATLAMAGSLAGPWGAAAGGAIGLFLDLTSSSDGYKTSISDLTATLNQNTGAVTNNTRAYIAKQLQDQGVLDAAQQLGLNLDDVTSAALGNEKAMTRVNNAMKALGYLDNDGANAIAKVHDALDQQSGAVHDSQVAFKQLNDALGGNVHSANNARTAHVRLKRSLADEKTAALNSAKSFTTLGKDLDNAKVSLNGWIHQMAAEANALVNFGNNARTAADKGLRDGLIKQLEALGPAGALRMRQLANATQEQIGRANAAFDTYHRGAQNLIATNAYLSNHPPILTVDGVPQSLQALRQVAAQLNALHDKTITLTTVRSTGGHSIAGNAAGGTIPGPRYPYRDKVLRMVAPGEEIISNSHGQADMNRAALKAGNRGARLAVVGGMASGGTVGATYTRGSNTPKSGGGTASVAFAPVRVSVDVTGPWGTKTIETVARAVYASESDADHAYTKSREMR